MEDTIKTLLPIHVPAGNKSFLLPPRVEGVNQSEIKEIMSMEDVFLYLRNHPMNLLVKEFLAHGYGHSFALRTKSKDFNTLIDQMAQLPLSEQRWATFSPHKSFKSEVNEDQSNADEVNEDQSNDDDETEQKKMTQTRAVTGEADA